MNLPNKLTLSRFVIAVLMVLILLSNKIEEQYRNNFTAAIFLLGLVTDFLDGYIARKRDKITIFGIFADPIADKILLTSAMISLVYLQRFSPYVAIALICRDIIMTGFRLIAAEQKIIIPAVLLGKIKTVTESILVIYLILNYDIPYVEISLIIVSFLLAYISLIKTMLLYRRVFSNIH